ncbi:MAG: hypothetical protein OXQ29_05835 [Rhodospirillaceae bacterium]|nr:hypothetical protein [Rhodospirillaceae bacterium]
MSHAVTNGGDDRHGVCPWATERVRSARGIGQLRAVDFIHHSHRSESEFAELFEWYSGVEFDRNRPALLKVPP